MPDYKPVHFMHAQLRRQIVAHTLAVAIIELFTVSEHTVPRVNPGGTTTKSFFTANQIWHLNHPHQAQYGHFKGVNKEKVPKAEAVQSL